MSGYHRCVRIGADSLPQHYRFERCTAFQGVRPLAWTSMLNGIVGGEGSDPVPHPQRENQPLPPPLSTLESVVPSAAGLSATAMSADFMASTLSSALPLPPAMMAPAWPMRRPGGAVMPAMKPAIGFLRPFLASLLMNSAASSSA